MPTMIPAQSIFDLPNVIVEALRALTASDVGNYGIVKVDGQQSGHVGGIAIPDTKSVAEITDARRKTVAAIQRDMAPAEAGIIDHVVADHPAPIPDRVVNRRRRVGVRQ